jgi:hypothetical protein
MNSERQGLERFAEDFRQEVVSRVEAAEEGGFSADAFTELFIEYLQEKAGELDDTIACSHQSKTSRGAILEMSGYGLSENGETLDLLVTLYSGDVPPRRLTADEVSTAFTRLARLYSEAANGGHQKLEESCPAFDAFQSIWHAVKMEKSLLQVRLILLTDSIVPDTIKRPADQDKETIRFNYDIWDMERLYRLVSSGQVREKIEINFEEVTGDSVPCLQQPDSNPEYAAYLAIFPGKALVELYGRYGARLLERNVRSFLQVRGNVNKGIRKTIVDEPHMFLAFNNGLSVTAEHVETVIRPDGGLGIRAIRDLQIVNGGQTTASIFHASKRERGAEVNRIFVQAKITVLCDPAQMDEVIPRISRYANSQNKIQDADLVANDAYHRQIEELSRTIWAPAVDGTVRQTHWFYERARGQYADELARERTPAKMKAFESTAPKHQVFTKVDLAKYQLTGDMLPHIVSRGNQKCLMYFMDKDYLTAHQQREGHSDTGYFERLIARTLLFRTAEALVRKEREKYPAYRANLVTYAIARLVHETEGRLDLARIWREQAVPEDLQKALMDLVQTVWLFITTENKGGNVTEFCKKPGTWDHFLKENVFTNGGFTRFKVAPVIREKETTSTTAKAYAAQEVIRRVSNITSECWFAIAEWGRSTGRLTGLECTIAVETAARIARGEAINARQAELADKILKHAQELGAFDTIAACQS